MFLICSWVFLPVNILMMISKFQDIFWPVFFIPVGLILIVKYAEMFSPILKPAEMFCPILFLQDQEICNSTDLYPGSQEFCFMFHFIRGPFFASIKCSVKQVFH